MDGKTVIKTCRVCGAEFEVLASQVRTKSGDMCCSKDCDTKWQKRHREYFTCVVCGKDFYLRPSEVKKRTQFIYCSKECKLEGTGAHKICVGCGKEFRVPKSNEDRYKYCSLQCKQQYMKGEVVVCERCGKEFYSSIRNKRHYCSEECRRPPHINTCQNCGKEFRVCPGEATKGQKYCSTSCYHQSTEETEPEKLVRLCLEKLNETFEQESKIDRYAVDFYLPERNLALEIDGVYWHSQRPGADRRKTKRLNRKGYFVIRIPDTPFYGEITTDTVEIVRSVLTKNKDVISGLDAFGTYPVTISPPTN